MMLTPTQRRMTIIGIVLIELSFALGLVTATAPVRAVDLGIAHALQLRRGVSPAWLIDLFQGVSAAGTGWPRALTLVGLTTLLAWRHRPRLAAVLVAMVAIALAVDTWMKLAFARVRPALNPWLDTPVNLSYPSGHSANTLVLLVGAALISRQAGADRSWLGVALAVSIAMGISRVMLCVHWPTDVLGAWLFGGGAAILGGVAAQLVAPRRALELAR
jgi:undecaprenyl-diphosphatase